MNPLLGYRTASWRPVPVAWRWWALARYEFGSLFRTKWGIALYFLCLLPALVQLVMVMIAFGVLQFVPVQARGRMGRLPGNLDPQRAEFYVDPVLQVMPGMVFVMLLAAVVVARAIAKDRTTNALELYWTRSISPRTYLLAKWFGTTLLVGTVTVVAPLVLWATATLLAEDWTMLTTTALPFVRALLGLAVATMAWTAIAIGISAGATSPNTAMVVWCMLLVGSSALGTVLAAVLRESWLLSSLSVWGAGGTVVRAIAGFGQMNASLPTALAVLGGLTGALLVRALRRLRLTEAIA